MIGLTRATAERIRRVLDRSPGNAQNIGTGGWKGNQPFLVRCTSSTAAASTGVGAQCYPGVILGLDPADTTQPTLGTVWLTLLTSGDGVGVPTSGRVYECLLAGNVEAATDDTRPRAFSAAGDASKPSPDCSTILGLLRKDNCFRLSIVSGLGACSCIDTSQTADLTWDSALAAMTANSSDDVIRGCPPGVITTDCPPGAPKKWSFVVSGFTGTDCTAINGNWTATWTSGQTWVRSQIGVTATLVLSGTTGTLTFTLDADNSTLAVFSLDSFLCCASNEMDRDSFAGCDAAPATLTLTPATACGLGIAYTPILDVVDSDCGPCIRLQLIPTTGYYGKTIAFLQVGCGKDSAGKPFIDFASNDPLLCTGTAGDACEENSVRLRVTCTICPNSHYVGPGWYCADGSCTYLVDDPGDDVSITAGVFDTEAECGCGPEVVLEGCSCVETTGPIELCVAFSLESGDDLLGLAGVTLPISWYYFVDADGNGTYGYEWEGLINLNAVGGSNFTLEGVVSSGDIVLGIPDCDISPFGVGFSSAGGGTISPPNPFLGWSIDPSVPACSTATGGEVDWPTDVCDFFASVNAVDPIVAFYETNNVPSNTACYKATFIVNGGCVQSPPPPPPSTTYNCIDGACVAVYDGTGSFATIEECAAACGGGGGGGGPNDCPCGTELDSHPDLHAAHDALLGPSSSGTLAWVSGTTYAGMVGPFTATLTCNGGVWHLVWGSADVDATGQGCGAMYAVFNLNGAFTVTNP